MDPRETLVHLLAERSVEFGEFTLSSGLRSPYYIDARMTTMSPEGLRAVGEAALDAMLGSGWAPDAVGGLTIGADPIAYAIALCGTYSGRLIRAFSVRKDVKAHGTRKRIEGPFRDGDSVVIVEDVVTTGASALAAAAAVEHEHGRVIGVLAVLDREEGGRAAIEAGGYQLVALATAQQVVDAARARTSPGSAGRV